MKEFRSSDWLFHELKPYFLITWYYTKTKKALFRFSIMFLDFKICTSFYDIYRSYELNL